MILGVLYQRCSAGCFYHWLGVLFHIIYFGLIWLNVQWLGGYILWYYCLNWLGIIVFRNLNLLRRLLDYLALVFINLMIWLFINLTFISNNIISLLTIFLLGSIFSIFILINSLFSFLLRLNLSVFNAILFLNFWVDHYYFSLLNFQLNLIRRRANQNLFIVNLFLQNNFLLHLIILLSIFNHLFLGNSFLPAVELLLLSNLTLNNLLILRGRLSLNFLFALLQYRILFNYTFLVSFLHFHKSLDLPPSLKLSLGIFLVIIINHVL